MTDNPLEITKLKNLKLAAKIISGQLRNGIHLGRKTGAGSEFEQYRHYEPGDDPKRIDWKLYSRSNKYQVKESPVESQLDLKLMLDLSGSMKYEEKGISRLDYAKNLLASLAYLGHQQGDIVSLYTLKDGKVNREVAPSIKSFQRILHQLEISEAAGAWPMEPLPLPYLKSKNRELIIFVSDFLQQDREWSAIVQQMQHPNKEIVLFQILGDQEISFDQKGSFRFEDLESGQTLNLTGLTVQKIYNEAIQKYLRQLETSLVMPNVHLLRTTLHQPISQVIQKYLLKKEMY